MSNGFFTGVRYKKTGYVSEEITYQQLSLRNCDSFFKKGMVNEQEYREDVALYEKRLSIARDEKQLFDAEVSAIRFRDRRGDCLWQDSFSQCLYTYVASSNYSPYK